MDIVFVASVAVIAPHPAQSRKLYVDALGLPLAAAEGSEYWHSEQLAGTKSFGIWPLREAAQACFGQPEWPAHLSAPQASIEFEVADGRPAALGRGPCRRHLVRAVAARRQRTRVAEHPLRWPSASGSVTNGGALRRRKESPISSSMVNVITIIVRRSGATSLKPC